MLRGYDWPGNIRELVHALELMLTSNPDVVELAPPYLPEYIRIKLLRSSIRGDRNKGEDHEKQLYTAESFQPIKEIRKMAVADSEKTYLNNLIIAVDANVREACRISGLSRAQLYSLLKKHSISLKN